MGARPGEWNLLHESKDPMSADADQIDVLATFYSDMAKTIHDEAAVLKRIGEGDESQFKGQGADKVRERSKSVAEKLEQMSGRYDAVRDALRGYVPALQRGLAESKGALDDAVAARDSMTQAKGMADPRVDRPDDAPPLTSDEEGAGRAKDAALDNADSAAAAAIARLRRAQDELDAAGRAASNTIRAAWKDGLHDTLGDKIRAFFKNFLAILIKVLTWIGIALAVIAIIIPGLGIVSLMAAVTAGVAFAATIAQAAMGDASFVSVIMAAVGIVTLGAGAAITKMTSLTKGAMIGKGAAHTTKITENANKAMAYTANQAARRKEIFDDVLTGRATVEATVTRLKELPARMKEIEASAVKQFKAADLGAVKPNWWNVGKLGEIAKNDKKAILEQFGEKGYSFDKLIGVDGLKGLKDIQTKAAESGITLSALRNVDGLVYYTGGAKVYGWANTIFGLGANPTGIGADQSRWAAWEAAKNDFPGGNPSTAQIEAEKL
ncbi:hypothetical protein ACPEEZ_02875 [Frigoribacterium sp. 2-23]|uniref:hypothetical protein n=1 Tax=Frigoribacterium sp. 2-23 TaxID=3415006 RepID=UPI003C6FE070